jgi:short-subunit dehydrogenase involved in D-alanine esterification of teichoic acids
VADVATAAGRTELVRWATTEYSALNVLVNNAGI